TAFGLALLISYPVVWAHLLAAVVFVGQLVFVKSRETSQARLARELFTAHPGMRIAVAGSYGKTSMKELLATVLSEGKNVAATPGNMNVVSSHLKFAQALTGDEDIVIVEFGEGKPGDVARFSDIVRPSHAVITGLAPAHLDQYKTLEAAGKDVFSVASAVEHVYVNADSPETESFMRGGYETYGAAGALGWSVKHAKTDISGTTFELHKKGRKTLKLQSKLVGLHHVGPLAFVAAFAMQTGMTEKQIRDGVAKTAPYEHRMQPYALNGAWILDDTYNGNLEGIRAGTALLASLKAKRKWYVTPGLVDQGQDVAKIHREIGALIAEARPDVVVLMQNSTTEHIIAGLETAGFKGELRIQDDPLEFYLQLGDIVAKGDVVLMQNDWTDNYK
ncbi:hypothetical protein KDA14_05195, partial [Candidatus Saccharibacteria bacterium]|nr:hypothetical protein [Candidatus Saccharibacteria bacterium]